MKRLLALAMSLAAWPGCRSTCDHLQETAVNLAMKASGCGLKMATFDRMKCDAAISPCNGQDRARIENWLDCLDRLPSCEPPAMGQWNQMESDCASALSGLSGACADGGAPP